MRRNRAIATKQVWGVTLVLGTVSLAAIGCSAAPITTPVADPISATVAATEHADATPMDH